MELIWLFIPLAIFVTVLLVLGRLIPSMAGDGMTVKGGNMLITFFAAAWASLFILYFFEITISEIWLLISGVILFILWVLFNSQTARDILHRIFFGPKGAST